MNADDSTPVTEDEEMDNSDDMIPTSPEPEAMDADEAMLEPLLSILTEDAQEEVQCANCEILKIVEELGGGTRAYRRERKKALKAIVAEIYSPPRVTRCAKLLPSLGLSPGFALDLTTVNSREERWDFDMDDKQDEAMALIDEEVGKLTG